MAGVRPMDRSSGPGVIIGPVPTRMQNRNSGLEVIGTVPTRLLIHSTIFVIVFAVTLTGGWKRTQSIEYLVQERSFAPQTTNEGFLNKPLVPVISPVLDSATTDQTATAPSEASSQAPADQPRTEIIVHVVSAGDTVSDIATKYGVSVDTIRWSNKLDDVDSLSIGQKLSILPVSGVIHTVASGDTLSDIANKYKTDPNAIIDYNKLANPDKLSLDAKLIIPGGKYQEPARPAPVARSDRVDTPAAPAAVQSAAKPPPPPPVSSSSVDVVNFALQYLGYPYVWGGSGPRSFDCSGFVYYVFNQKGIRMPRDLWGQVQVTKTVTRSQLQPGDIVFFVNTYAAGLTHDGIYIGGGKFVNAESEWKGVAIADLNSAYWSSRFYVGGRP